MVTEVRAAKLIFWLGLIPVLVSVLTGCGGGGGANAVTGYSISGSVNLGGTALAGVTLNMSGSATSSASSDASGNYSLTNVADGNYILTPSKTGYTFNPSNIAVSVKGANVSGKNFTATAVAVQTYDISGSVTTNGLALSDVTLSLGGSATTIAITDVNGNYRFTGLAGGSYSITPSKLGYTFSPTSLTVTVNGASISAQDFTATATTVPTYTLGGTVTGAVTQNVMVTLSGAGNPTTIATNSLGDYSFAGLANGTYTVTPQLTGYTFNPTKMLVTINGANVVAVNFVAITAAATYSINGSISGATTSGVTLSLSGPATAAGTSDPSGNYSFANLPNGNYTITPSKPGYTFSPASKNVNVNGGNVTVAGFVSVAVPVGQMGGAIQGTPLKLSAVVTTLAGSAGSSGILDGTGSAALFNGPESITTDGTNLFVADMNSHTIRKIVIGTGVTSTLAGSAGMPGGANGVGGAATFNGPKGITTDGINLYVADTGNQTIRQVVIATGAVTTLAGTAGLSGSTDGVGAAALFNNPYGITTDGTHLYVADTFNCMIRKIVIATQETVTLAGTAGLCGAVNGVGGAAGFNHPGGITTDGTFLYVTDGLGQTIRKVEIATRVVSTLAGSGAWGSLDGTGTAASFFMPDGITTDGTHLYVADTFNHSIRKIVIASGVVSTLAGSTTPGISNGTGSLARFNMPHGITSDGISLYVADTGNHTIRRMQ